MIPSYRSSTAGFSTAKGSWSQNSSKEWARDYLAVRGALAFKDAKPHLLSICKAVSSLHNLGIIHCDLKPDNMKVVHGPDGTETIKIFDFGFVKFMHEGEICTERCGPFNRLGTPNYMPIEQILSNTFDHRVDIYAVGTMMYQMLCGNLPFESTNPREVMDMQIRKMPEDPRTRRPDLNIPCGVNDIVMRALRKTREERFQTMDDMAESIDNWQA